MIAKDILRIALFILLAIFSLRLGTRIRIRDSARLSNPAETEDTETQQLLQPLQDTREKINLEPMVFENQTAGKKS